MFNSSGKCPSVRWLDMLSQLGILPVAGDRSGGFAESYRSVLLLVWLLGETVEGL